MDQTLAWAEVKGNSKCRRTGWGLEALREMKDVSGKLARVGWGQRACPLCPPSRATWCPLWYFTALRIMIVALLSLGRVRGRGRGGVKGGGGDSDSLDSDPEIAMGKGKEKEKGKGKGKGGGEGGGGDSDSSDSDPGIGLRKGKEKRKGKGKGKGVWGLDSESSDSESQVPVSSAGVRRGRAALESGAPAGKRRKKTRPSPSMGWSGAGQESGEQGSLPLP